MVINGNGFATGEHHMNDATASWGGRGQQQNHERRARTGSVPCDIWLPATTYVYTVNMAMFTKW